VYNKEVCRCEGAKISAHSDAGDLSFSIFSFGVALAYEIEPDSQRFGWTSVEVAKTGPDM